MAKQAKRQLAGSGEALPAGVVGEVLQTNSAAVTTNTSTYTNITSLSLTAGVWIISATSWIENSGSQTGGIHRLMIKGVDGSTASKDQITTNSTTAGISYSATFAPRTVVVTDADADKTIKVRQISVTAAGTAYAYVTAIRIA